MISSQLRMRRFENGTHDPKMIAAILDEINTVHVGCFDEEYPYVVPLSYGYEIRDGKLLVYLHGAREGHKVDLWKRNPHVCLTFSAMYNHPDRLYRGCMHDYRSVIALGTIAPVDRKTQSRLNGTAVQSLLRHNRRRPNQFSVPHYMWMGVYVVTCDMENVVGKLENPVEDPREVPFPDVYALPENDEPYDTAYFYHRKAYRSVPGAWAERGEPLPELPEEGITLPGGKRLRFTAEWRARSGETVWDFDLSALLLNGEGKVARRYDMVFYNQRGNGNDSVTHLGDDALSGTKGREAITAEPVAIPEGVSAVELQLSGWGDDAPGVDALGDVRVTVSDDASGEAIGAWSFSLAGLAAPAASLLTIRREGSLWRAEKNVRPLSSRRILDRSRDLGLDEWEE